MTSFYRVDNRLVHGQIISTWMPHLRVKHFLVVSDTVPDNQLQMAMFRMAIPSEREFHALDVTEAAKWLNARRKSPESIMSPNHPNRPPRSVPNQIQVAIGIDSHDSVCVCF